MKPEAKPFTWSFFWIRSFLSGCFLFIFSCSTFVLGQNVQKSFPAVSEKKSIATEDEPEDEDSVPSIHDPLLWWNRAMFNFNDRLYFWVLKPASSGYNKVIPEKGRIGIRNFFDNLLTPVRLVNCFLQGKIKSAGTE